MMEKTAIRTYLIWNYEEFFGEIKPVSIEKIDDEGIIHGGSCNGGVLGKCKTAYDKDFMADVVFLFARSELVKCWKRLKELNLIDKTVLVLDESGAVDWKCGTMFLRYFDRSFPAFLTYRDDFLDNPFFVAIRPIGSRVFSIERSSVEYASKRLLCMICANKVSHLPNEMYSVRKKCIKYFENHLSEEFDLYGPWWGDKYSNWKGIVKDKREAYHNHKFALCIENSYEPGYVTEKIFDCFRYGIVPVYAGPPNADEYIPSDSYISFYKFKSIEKLVSYLKEIDESEYYEFIDSANRFIKSEQYIKMSCGFDELSQKCVEIFSTNNRELSRSQVVVAGTLDSLIQIYRGTIDNILGLKKRFCRLKKWFLAGK